MDAISYLKEQHKEVEGLLKKVNHAEDAGERKETFRQIDHNLRVHSIIEEEIFYPEFKRRAESKDERVEVYENLEEHRLVKTTIEDLEKTDPNDESYKGKLHVLTEMVKHHVEEEEHKMFKQAQSLFEKDELEEIGLRLERAASQASVPV